MVISRDKYIWLPSPSGCLQILISFYSDENYVLGGFELSYVVLDASNASEPEACPEDCFNGTGRGRCVGTHCLCTDGFGGIDCATPVTPNSNYLIASGAGNLNRIGSAYVYLEDLDQLWLHGGSTLASIENSLVVYSFATGTWSTVSSYVGFIDSN